MDMLKGWKCFLGKILKVFCLIWYKNESKESSYLFKIDKKKYAKFNIFICQNIFNTQLFATYYMAHLKDPLQNRKVLNCPLPYQTSLTEAQLFPATGLDVNLLR